MQIFSCFQIFNLNASYCHTFNLIPYTFGLILPYVQSHTPIFQSHTLILSFSYSGTKVGTSACCITSCKWLISMRSLASTSNCAAHDDKCDTEQLCLNSPKINIRIIAYELGKFSYQLLLLLLLSKTAKFPFPTMDYSPWSSKNLINRNRLKKFMQVCVNVTCMYTNFGGSGLSGFRDTATLKNGQI